MSQLCFKVMYQCFIAITLDALSVLKSGTDFLLMSFVIKKKFKLKKAFQEILNSKSSHSRCYFWIWKGLRIDRVTYKNVNGEQDDNKEPTTLKYSALGKLFQFPFPQNRLSKILLPENHSMCFLKLQAIFKKVVERSATMFYKTCTNHLLIFDNKSC